MLSRKDRPLEFQFFGSITEKLDFTYFFHLFFTGSIIEKLGWNVWKIPTINEILTVNGIFIMSIGKSVEMIKNTNDGTIWSFEYI